MSFYDKYIWGEEYLHYYDFKKAVKQCKENRIKILWWDLILITKNGIEPKDIIDFSREIDIDKCCDMSLSIVEKIPDKEKYLYIPVLQIEE